MSKYSYVSKICSIKIYVFRNFRSFRFPWRNTKDKNGEYEDYIEKIIHEIHLLRWSLKNTLFLFDTLYQGYKYRLTNKDVQLLFRMAHMQKIADDISIISRL